MNHILDKLNEEQLHAVTTDNKHVLILAGAGSGKTRAITARIIYLLEEKKINPYNILAVTFTNKAANEMKERVQKETRTGKDLLIKTFHSFGAYLLRREALFCKRSTYFQIYDADDSKKAVTSIMKKYGFQRSELGRINKWIKEYKQQVEDSSAIKYGDEEYLEIYNNYNKFLLDSNCFDFEDLILQPIKLFREYPEIIQKYQKRFKYILIDEYQDTNKAQFELVRALAGGDNNVMVVGDEDQSIYKFRGADINNILSFEKHFEDTKIIRMEQNYRSTSNILNTANNVIDNNSMRIGKNLYTNIKGGEKVNLLEAYNEVDEVEKILYLIDKKQMKLRETAILYRTNNQSRPFEQLLNKNKIPYVIFGTIGFFEREEIKDSVSILKWLINPKDRIAFSRFVNKPARGIGEKSLLEFYAESKKYKDMLDALVNVEKINSISKKAKDGLKTIAEIFKDREIRISEYSIDKLITHYLKELELWEYYKENDINESTEKIANLTEFITSIENRGTGEEALLALLEEVTLTTSIDKDEKTNYNKLKLMTIHNAKGLEFENVFIAGLEEGLFPHANSDTKEEFEEERRLFYVAITRAKKNLTISYCKRRRMFGFEDFQEPSQFLFELPKEYIERTIIENTDYRADEEFSKGDIVRHRDYGKGKIIMIKYTSGKRLATIDFWDYSMMEVILEYTKLERVYD